MGWQDTSLPFWREEDGTPKPTFLNKRYRTPNMEALGKQGMGLHKRLRATYLFPQPVQPHVRHELRPPPRHELDAPA